MNTLPINADDRLLWDTWLSHYHLPVLTVADEAGTLEALCAKPMTSEDLGARLSLDARALTIHLGMLGAMGYVDRREGVWHATAQTRTWMHPQAEGYFGPVFAGYQQSSPIHEQLMSTLKTGKRPNTAQSAAEGWEKGSIPPEAARAITSMMNAHSRAASIAVASQPIFNSKKAFLDVGGGSGIFSIALAKAQPELQATIMEIDSICTEAQGYIDAAGVSAQVDTKAVNMFTEAWPEGYDSHFFSNIFHDWADETCLELAQKSFATLEPGGHIMLHEMLMNDDGCGPMTTAAFSVLMLLGTNGRQYTFSELKGFLESAGFVDVQTQRTGGGYYSLTTARKPG